MNAADPLSSSFRDPSGHVFKTDGKYFRQVNPVYSTHYTMLMESGLYETLTRDGSLIPHDELNGVPVPDGAFRILLPRQLRYMNYPYEWPFSALKDAALLTLRIQKKAMEYGMSLKDATPYNIVFEGTKPIFIDTLSFEQYDYNKPWVAYRQFCENFLAPLLLATNYDPRMMRMQEVFAEGFPLDLCAALLPTSSRFKSLAALHIHMQSHIGGEWKGKNDIKFSKNKLLRIIEHLYGGIVDLTLASKTSTWSDYYQASIRQDNYLHEKEKAFAEILTDETFTTVLDLGANTGQFSLILSEKGKLVTAIDADTICVERLFQHSKVVNQDITTLVIDIMNPSPAIGWNNAERESFLHRQKPDLVLALALIHHICIGKNLPFSLLAEMLANLGPKLLIEFVPKTDEKVQKLLQHREDIFPDYDEGHFIHSFSENFSIISKKEIGNSGRMLFLMQGKGA